MFAHLCIIQMPYAYCMHTNFQGTLMGHRVRKTLNIDADKLKRVKEYLGLETDTEVVDRVLDDYDFERRLIELFRSAPASFKAFRSPLTSRPPRR